jgi:hypothetical protein
MKDITKMIHKEPFLVKDCFNKFVKHKQNNTFVFNKFFVTSTSYRFSNLHLEFAANFLLLHYHTYH